MGLKEDMDKAVCMAGKMEFEYKLREVIRMITAYRLRKNELDARIKMLEETLIEEARKVAERLETDKDEGWLVREVVNSVQIAVGVELAQCKRQLYKVVQKLDILESIPVEEGKTKFQFE